MHRVLLLDERGADAFEAEDAADAYGQALLHHLSGADGRQRRHVRRHHHGLRPGARPGSVPPGQSPPGSSSRPARNRSNSSPSSSAVGRKALAGAGARGPPRRHTRRTAPPAPGPPPPPRAGRRPGTSTSTRGSREAASRSDGTVSAEPPSPPTASDQHRRGVGVVLARQVVRHVGQHGAGRRGRRSTRAGAAARRRCPGPAPRRPRCGSRRAARGGWRWRVTPPGRVCGTAVGTRGQHDRQAHPELVGQLPDRGGEPLPLHVGLGPGEQQQRGPRPRRGPGAAQRGRLVALPVSWPPKVMAGRRAR